jgi:endonuclease III
MEQAETVSKRHQQDIDELLALKALLQDATRLEQVLETDSDYAKMDTSDKEDIKRKLDPMRWHWDRYLGYLVTFEFLQSLTLDELARLLRPLTCQYKHAITIISASKYFVANYNGQMPMTMEEQIVVNEIGPKKATLNIGTCGATGTEVPAVPVDLHVSRCSRKLKWVDRKGKDETEIARKLMLWVKREQWLTVNELFGGFGQILDQKPSHSQARKLLFHVAKHVSMRCLHVIQKIDQAEREAKKSV